jgi:CubicO group peptidase (beta-lactamase class C family)
VPDSSATINTDALDALVQAAMTAWQVPGASVGVVRDDQVIYLKGFGVREAGREGAVTPDTLFAVGSTTKAFTTTAMGMLVDDGKMAWDDPVRKHLQFFRLSDPLASEQVTIRDLVCHRTGLSRHDQLWYGSPWGREEIIRKLAHIRPTTSFRSRWEYQNIMYLAAGEAVGRASGGTWEEFVRQRILAPLGMSGANFSTTEAETAPDHASPHREKEKRIEVIPWRNLDNVAPAGSINAGARDMCKWVRVQLGDGVFEGQRLVSAESLAETKTPQVVLRMDEPTRAMNPDTHLMTYGLGWILQDYRGQLVISHGGGIDGFRAQVALVPDAKLGLVVLSNQGNTQMPEALSNALTDHLLSLPEKDWNAIILQQVEKSRAEGKERRKEQEAKRHPDTKPSRELAAYSGAFEEAAYGTAHVSLENERLVLQWSGYTRPLEHWHYDTFQIPDEPLEHEQVRFALGGDGEVATMQFLGMEFKAVRKATGAA